MVYNMMTCEGFAPGFLGGCSMAWFGLAIMVFVVLILRRQCDDGIFAGLGYNFFGAMVGGGVGYLLLTVLTGEARWALLAGVGGVAVGGFLLGQFLDSNSGGGESY